MTVAPLTLWSQRSHRRRARVRRRAPWLSSRLSLLSLSLLACAVVTGCRTAEPEPDASDRPLVQAAVSSRVLAGHPLRTAGGLLESPGDASEALAVTVDFRALRDVPADAMRPAGPRIRLVTGSEGAVQVGPDRLSGLRVAEAESAAVFQSPPFTDGLRNRFESARAALPVGCTARFDLTQAGLGGEDSLGSMERRFSILVGRRLVEGRCELVIGVEVAAPGGVDPERGGLRERYETVLFDPVKSTRLGLALVSPSPLSGPEHRIAAFVRVEPAPESAGAGALAHRSAFERARRGLRSGRNEWPAAKAGEDLKLAAPGLEYSLEALRNPATRRAAMIALAAGSSAGFTEQLAEAAAEPMLNELTRIVLQAAGEPGFPAAGLELGWKLENIAFHIVEKRWLSGSLEAELVAVTVRWFGGLAVQPAACIELFETVRSEGELRTAIRTANVTLLDDSSARVRARAWQWLRARGLAPPDYDPFADTATRRVVLERAQGEVAPSER